MPDASSYAGPPVHQPGRSEQQEKRRPHPIPHTAGSADQQRFVQPGYKGQPRGRRRHRPQHFTGCGIARDDRAPPFHCKRRDEGGIT